MQAGLFVGAQTANGVTTGIANFQCCLLGILAKVVIYRTAEGRILPGEKLVTRAAMAQGTGPEDACERLEQMRLGLCNLPSETAKWSNIENPRAATVSGGNYLASRGMHGNLVDGHSGKIAVDTRPVGTAIETRPNAKLGAAVEQVFIHRILAHTAG